MLKIKSNFTLFFFCIALHAESTGYIELGTMAISQKSNTEPMLLHADKSLSSLDGFPLVQKEIDPYLSFEYINTFDDVLLTTTLNEENKLSFRAEGETFGIEAFIRPSDEFKNPYTLYSKRETTLVTETGAGAIYKIPVSDSSSLELAYILSKKNVLDDELGYQMPSLQREGYIHRAQCKWTNDLFKLTTGVFATQKMGSAENHKGADLELSSVYTFDKMLIQGTAKFSHTQYSDINPFFEKTLNQDNLKASLSLEYDYSNEGYYAIAGIMTNRQFSNIPFFDSSKNTLSLGIGRNF